MDLALPHLEQGHALVRQLLAAGGEVAIVGVVDRTPGIQHVRLYTEPSVLVASRGHRRAPERLTRAQLAALEHVEVQVAPGRGYRELARAYQRRGIERRVAVVVPSFLAAAAVVAKTDLVATLPASLIEVLGERLGLRVLAGPAPRIETEIKLAWHQRTHDAPALRAFRELVLRSLAVS